MTKKEIEEEEQEDEVTLLESTVVIKTKAANKQEADSVQEEAVRRPAASTHLPLIPLLAKAYQKPEGEVLRITQSVETSHPQHRRSSGSREGPPPLNKYLQF